MPYLEHLRIHRAPYIKHHDEMYPLENVIKQNSQLRSIDLYQSLPGLLYCTSFWLPKLENLRLRHFLLPHLDEPFAINFQNVTKFSMILNSSSPRYLHFPKLEELHINLEPAQIEEWLTFLAEHKSVRRFYLKYSDLSDRLFDDSQFIYPI